MSVWSGRIDAARFWIEGVALTAVGFVGFLGKWVGSHIWLRHSRGGGVEEQMKSGRLRECNSKSQLPNEDKEGGQILQTPYRVTLVVSDLGWVDSYLLSSPGRWAANVATYCPTRWWNNPILSQPSPGPRPPMSPCIWSPSEHESRPPALSCCWCKVHTTQHIKEKYALPSNARYICTEMRLILCKST